MVKKPTSKGYLMNFKTWLNENTSGNYFQIIHATGYSAGSHGFDGSDEVGAEHKDAFKSLQWTFYLKNKETEDLLRGLPMFIDYQDTGSFHERFIDIMCFVKVPEELIDKIKQIEQDNDAFTNGIGLSNLENYSFNGLADAIKTIVNNYTDGYGMPKARFSNVPAWVNLPPQKPTIEPAIKRPASPSTPKPGEDKEDYWTRQITNARMLTKRDYSGD